MHHDVNVQLVLYFKDTLRNPKSRQPLLVITTIEDHEIVRARGPTVIDGIFLRTETVGVMQAVGGRLPNLLPAVK
jgi:hypothetical protein